MRTMLTIVIAVLLCANAAQAQINPCDLGGCNPCQQICSAWGYAGDKFKKCHSDCFADTDRYVQMNRCYEGCSGHDHFSVCLNDCLDTIPGVFCRRRCADAHNFPVCFDQCQQAQSKQPETTTSTADASISVPLRVEHGTFRIPVLINDRITLDFVLDTGATDVSIPADVFLTLMRTGTITKADFLEQATYKMADGTTVPGQKFRIRSLQVAGKIVNDVVGSIAPSKGDLLLGQTFLQRFNSWSIDNERKVLVLVLR
jgi:clan AA aspartic protease (TIGR02281 family)